MRGSISKNNSGFMLIGTIIAVVIIAAIFFGSSYFSKDSPTSLEQVDVVTPQGQLKALNGAKSDMDKINDLTADRNSETKEILK